MSGARAAQQEGEDDELDALLQRYEQQAAADVAAVQQRGCGGAQDGRKRQRLSAADKREEALSQPLGADNKGFKLLSAMGYRQGQRIGKSGTGLAEPIPLMLKQDKLGLGAVSKKEASRELQRQREQEAEQRAAAEAVAAEAGRRGLQADYQQRAAAAAAARRLEGQLRKAQQVCETLDTAAGIDRCVMWQAPPAQAAAAASAAALAAAAAADELLEQCEPCHTAEAGVSVRAGREEAADFALLYERQARAALQAGEQPQVAREQPEQQDDELREWEAWQALPPAQQLAAVVQRLRECYFYCMYCGCRYDSLSDMRQHCPGPTEDDH